MFLAQTAGRGPRGGRGCQAEPNSHGEDLHQTDEAYTEQDEVRCLPRKSAMRQRPAFVEAFRLLLTPTTVSASHLPQLLYHPAGVPGEG